MTRRSWTGGAVAALAAGFLCRASGDEVKAAGKKKPKWVPAKYAKVIAYRFADLSIPAGSLIANGAVSTVELERKKLKETVLSEEQIAKLLAAAPGSAPSGDPVGCYEPHHIFVFVDDAGHALAAVEICFQCMSAVYLPASKSYTEPDFRALAKLSDETVGLVDGQKADDFIKKLDEEEKREKAAAEAAAKGK